MGRGTLISESASLALSYGESVQPQLSTQLRKETEREGVQGGRMCPRTGCYLCIFICPDVVEDFWHFGVKFDEGTVSR